MAQLSEWAISLASTGRRARCSIRLPGGTIRVGGTPDCDLTLPGAGNAVCHLEVAEATLAAHSEAGACSVNRRRLRATQRMLRDGDRVKVGGCIMRVAKATGVPTSDQRDKSRFTWHWYALCLALAGATMLGVLALFISSPPTRAATGAARQALAPAQALRRLALVRREIAAHPGLTHITASQDAGGAIRLAGQCRASGELTLALARLRARNIDLINNVFCSDQLVREVQAIVLRAGYEDVRVLPGADPQTLIISGDILQNDRWAHVAQALAHVARLRSWTVVNDTGMYLGEIVAILRAAHLSSGFSVVRRDGQLTITGQLPLKDQQQLLALLQAWRVSHPGSPRVVFQDFPVNRSTSKVFASPISSISGTPGASVLELQNGARMQVGSTASDGLIITQLNSRGIELRGDDALLYIPMRAYGT